MSLILVFFKIGFGLINSKFDKFYSDIFFFNIGLNFGENN